MKITFKKIIQVFVKKIESIFETITKYLQKNLEILLKFFGNASESVFEMVDKIYQMLPNFFISHFLIFSEMVTNYF